MAGRLQYDAGRYERRRHGSVGYRLAVVGGGVRRKRGVDDRRLLGARGESVAFTVEAPAQITPPFAVGLKAETLAAPWRVPARRRRTAKPIAVCRPRP